MSIIHGMLLYLEDIMGAFPNGVLFAVLIIVNGLSVYSKKRGTELLVNVAGIYTYIFFIHIVMNLITFNGLVNSAALFKIVSSYLLIPVVPLIIVNVITDLISGEHKR